MAVVVTVACWDQDEVRAVTEGEKGTIKLHRVITEIREGV